MPEAEQASRVLDLQLGSGIRPGRARRPLRAICPVQPALGLVEPTQPCQHLTADCKGRGYHRLLLPSVFLGDGNRVLCQTERDRGRQPAERSQAGETRQAADLEPGAADAARQLQRLFQMTSCRLELEQRQLAGAERPECLCAEIAAHRGRVRLLVPQSRLQRPHRRERSAQVLAATRLPQTGTGHQGVEARPARGGTETASRRAASRYAALSSRRPSKARPLGEHQGQLGVGRRGVGREGGHQVIHGRPPALQPEAEVVVGEQVRGVRPVPGRLGVADRLDDVPVCLVPLARRTVQRLDGRRPGHASQLELQQVREQPVIPEPGTPHIQRGHEGVGVLELLEDPL